MRIFAATLVLFISAGACAPAGPRAALPNSLCNHGGQASGQVTNLEIVVASDQHGGSASIKACPDRVFSIDFSKSNLFSSENARLLDQLQRGAVLGGPPVEMTISGYLRERGKDELRDYIMVTNILGYRLP